MSDKNYKNCLIINKVIAIIKWVTLLLDHSAVAVVVAETEVAVAAATATAQ